MFCSKCGKTLTPESSLCPHCDTPVGDSRFEGNGYTAVQQRFASGEAAITRPHTPYTRTTYTSAGEDEGEQPSGDIYSRTTYRPLLKDEKPEQKDADAAAAEAPVSARDAGETDKPEPAAAHPAATVIEEQPVAAIAGDASIVIAPLKPIKKTGISPEVQRYIRRMDELKSKKTAKTDGGDGAETDEVLDKLAAEAQAEDAQDGSEREGAVKRRARSAAGAHRAMPNWVKPAATILCIVIILGVAGYALLMNLSNVSRLEGVGYDLRDQGIKLIQSRLEHTYRDPIAQMMASGDAAGYAAELEKSHQEIQALMPAEGSGQKNDKLFVQTLDVIQGQVDNALMADAIAMGSRDDPTLANTLLATADAAWAEVTNSVTRLDEAKELQQLQGIKEGAEPTPTPEASATPTPSPYKNMPKGTKHKDVKRLQNRLHVLGFFNGTVDGVYGNVTVNAVKKFQQYIGLDATGIATVETQERIYADDAPYSKATPKPSSAPTLSAGQPDQQQQASPDEPSDGAAAD